MIIKAIDHRILEKKYWTQTLILILKDSLFLIVWAIYFYAIVQIERFQPKPIILEATVNLLLVWVFTKWFKNSLNIFIIDG